MDASNHILLSWHWTAQVNWYILGGFALLAIVELIGRKAQKDKDDHA